MLLQFELEHLCKLFRILLCGIFVLSPPVIWFTQFYFLSVCSHSYLPYIWGYNPILIYLVIQVVPALIPGNSFSWLLCSFGISPTMFSCCCFQHFITFCHYKCSRLILHISCPTTRISHFSKGVLVPFTREWYYKLRFGCWTSLLLLEYK